MKLARHVFTGERVAVKVIEKLKLDAVSRAHLYQEVRCMKLVQHPHVVKLYEVIDTQTKLYLVLELGDGGDMYDYIMKHRRGLPEEQARKYFIQVCVLGGFGAYLRAYLRAYFVISCKYPYGHKPPQTTNPRVQCV